MKTGISAALGAVLLMGLFSTPADASVKKGQKAYLKSCKKCHGNGTKGAAMKTQQEWKEAFANDAKLFRAWHKDDKRAMEYINSSKFDRSASDLKDFLYHYGSDSGNVPSCG